MRGSVVMKVERSSFGGTDYYAAAWNAGWLDAGERL